MKRKLINWLCLTGVLSIIFYLLHDIIGGLNYPNYDRLSQAVSDLTATDAPSFVVATNLSKIYGTLSCVCCTLLCILVEEKNKKLKTGIYLFTIMSYISLIGYSLFPLSSSGYDGSVASFIHVYIITTLVVILSIISIVLLIMGFKKENSKLYEILSIISLTAMFAGAIGSSIVPKEYFGVIERFSTYSAVILTGILGIYGFNKMNENKLKINK